MEIRKKFFYFPFKRIPYVLYDSYEVTQTTLFISLFYKLSHNLVKYRFLRILLKLSFYRFFTQITISVPNDRIKIIYYGYENKIFFEFSGQHINDISCIYSKYGNKYIKEPFSGYPVYYKLSSPKINHKKQMKTFLMKHWRDLKSKRAKLHGDLTMFNILIKGERVISIDKKVVTNSIIFDHFYFYSYFMQIVADKNRKSISNQLKLIYKMIL